MNNNIQSGSRSNYISRCRRSEYDSEHIKDAKNVLVNYINENMTRIDKNKRIMCILLLRCNRISNTINEGLLTDTFATPAIVNHLRREDEKPIIANCRKLCDNSPAEENGL